MPRLSKQQQADNRERAERGQKVLEFYRSQQGIDPNSNDEEALTDMLADLRHTASQEKLAFELTVADSQMHFKAEINGED